jgi:hypothetical protein
MAYFNLIADSFLMIQNAEKIESLIYGILLLIRSFFIAPLYVIERANIKLT